MKLNNININKITEKINEKVKTFANSNDNELLIIGLLTIVIIIWVILYIIPGIFVNLFNTILGNVILFLIIILVTFKNLIAGIILFLIVLIIYRFLILSIYANANTNTNTNIPKSNIQEGFTWNKSSTDKFLEIQKTINPEIVFDTNEIQNQATQEEVNYFNKHGHWRWSKEVEDLYKDALDNNPYVRTDPGDAINTMRTIYNEEAILQMLSWQTKEGKFLLNGVSISDNSKGNPYEDLPNGWGDYAFNSKQISQNNNVIKCGYNKPTNETKTSANTSNTNELQLQEIQYKGNDGIVYNHVKKIIPLDYNNLEKKIPGFSFINGPCNPCEALNNPPNYKCPFVLDISGNMGGVTPVWQHLWGLKNN
jgi:hypothetical protein